MKRNFKQAISCLLTLTLLLTSAVVPVFAKETAPPQEDQKTRPDKIYTLEPDAIPGLKAEIKELYASEPGLVGRTHKMQAFIMELALHAKTKNPDFKIIPQDGIDLAFVDGDWNKGVQKSLISLVDGWGKEGMVGTSNGTTPNDTQKKYMELVDEGLMVSDTTVCKTQAQLDNYYARAKAWGIIPYPRIGGTLAQTLFPGKQWGVNGDYFWVEDPKTIGIYKIGEDTIDGARNVDKLTDAQNYLYNINSRPYDAWETWDDEEAATVAEGQNGDRTRITDSYGNGLLVPSAGGKYKPVVGKDKDSAATVANAITVYGDKWDWWWREAGLPANAGRETWLNALRNSDYDVIYIDSFYNHRALPNNQTPLTKAEIDSLKHKPDGGRRQVIAYLSIGSAEQNRWYCQDDWTWVDPTNPNTERSMKSGKVTSGGIYMAPDASAPEWLAMGYGGNYAEEAIVQWWNPEWRDIIINGGGKYKNVATGDNTSSIDRIINQGFDGVYLDNVGVYEEDSWTAFENYYIHNGGIPGESTTAPLVAQKLDYTENPVDVPNPDRGFYRANDGMVVPVSGTGTGSGIMNVGNTPTTVGGAQVNTRVSHVYFDLRNFSSNAFTARGTRYTKNYFAPPTSAGVTIGSRNDPNPEYATNLAYWKAKVLPTWPHGKSQPLTEDALAYIRDKLQQVRDGNGVAMVRFNYDGAGYGWVSVDHPQDGPIDEHVADIEPDKATVLEHIAQLKPILHEYEDVIMGVDAGMFGPWGEMHSTTFGTSPEAYTWLLNAWLDAVPESRSITVQGGAFLSWYNATYHTNYTFENMDQIPALKPGTPEARFGFFNDSYAYGEDEGTNYPDDWGSLSEGVTWPDHPLGDEDSYDRGRLMTWIRHQNSLYGGEAQGDETLWNTYPFVAWEASYAQTVYLNADYSDEVHDRWGDFEYTEENVTKKMENAYESPYKTEYAIFDPVYDGKTGAEYWRDRLGYRLVLRQDKASEWVAQNGILQLEGKIQNVGFGNIINKKNVSVILKSKKDGKTYKALTNLDARDWRPDLDSRASNTAAYRDLSFSVNMGAMRAITMGAIGEMPVGEYNIYLKINDPKETTLNKRSIRFANKGDGIWDEDLGANLIGSTIIYPAQRSDDADIAFAKAAVESTTYTAAQTDTGTEEKALAKINEVLKTLVLRDVKADVSKISYTAAVAGTSSNQSGADGSYVFTVGLNKGQGNEAVTQELTLTITAKQYSGSGGGGGGGGTVPPAATGQTTTSETLKNGSVVTTTTDNATGAQKITVKSTDGTVAELDKPKNGDMTGKITLGSNGKKTVVAIPLKDASGGTVAIITKKDGTEEIIKGSVANGGVLYVPVNSDVTIKVVENGMSFADANQAAWAKDAIAFVTAREMFLGTSSKEFSPNRAMTRGMLATVLYRLAGEPSVGANSFTDVDAGKYYTDAVTWAAKSGIVAGVGDNRFAQGSEITREQLVTMLYRYAGSPAVSGTLSGFNDAGQVADWAKPAFAWAIEQGITQGRTDTTIVPGAKATRSEVAAMLQRFVTASTKN